MYSITTRLSFDKEGSITRAKKLIDLYKQAGIPKERILIKLSSTWEGVEAARYIQPSINKISVRHIPVIKVRVCPWKHQAVGII